MSIRMQVTDADTKAAIQHLEGWEAVTDRYHRVALRRSVNQIAAQVEPGIPSKSGQAREDFGTRVGTESMSNMRDLAFASGAGGSRSAFGSKFLVGRAGWFGNVKSWYINIVESGASPHQITPKNPEGMLAIQGPAGAVFPHVVEHPGFPPHKFFENGTKNGEQITTENFQAAALQIMAAMVVKS